jgi:ADP-ribose pyrophosphatase YjhB (NUDIX family)
MSTSAFAIPAVGPLIFDDAGNLFLMQSSGKFGDDWIIPGGKVSFGETMEQALVREIREETALKLTSVEFLGLREFIEEKRHFIFLEFVAVAENPADVVLNEEATRSGWFTREQLAALTIAGPTRTLLNERYETARAKVCSPQ